MPSSHATQPGNARPAWQTRGLNGLWPGGLLGEAFGWLLGRPCPLCRQLPPPVTDRHGGGRRTGLCEPCARHLALPLAGLSGQAPLQWWSSGSYAGGLRQTLLHQRKRPDPSVIEVLLEPLQEALDSALAARRQSRPGRTPLLVPVPSWKRRANPLPGLIADRLARGLGLRRIDLLARSHPVLGQHRLGRRLRLENQRGSFELRACHGWRQPRPVLLVDDILTTGATLQNAAQCLEQGGWPVLGAACLARTPRRGDWLRTP